MTKLSMSEEEMLKRKYTRPYEKKIEELEQENNKLLDVINNQDVKIADLEKENANLNATLDLRRLQLDDSAEIIKEMQSKVDTLQKANAELKADYKVLSCSVGDFDELQEKLEGEQRKNNRLSDQLTKAEDLLLRFVELKKKPCAVGHSVNMLLYENACAVSAQFLKEIEK